VMDKSYDLFFLLISFALSSGLRVTDLFPFTFFLTIRNEKETKEKQLSRLVTPTPSF
jgi:hypothetical protein